MGEPGQDRVCEGGDEPTTQISEPAHVEPSSRSRADPPEPAAGAPLAVWPRAAGGGAAAVAALVLPAGADPTAEETLEPEPATAEDAIEPPPPEVILRPEPEPPAPDSPAETVQQHADASDTRTPERPLELTPPPQVLPLQPQPPAADAPGATLPPLPRTEPRLEAAAGVHATPLPPQPAVPAQAHVELAEPWPRETPLRPSPPAKVEAPRYLGRALKLAAAVVLALAGSVLLLVILYRWVDPPASTLMLGQRLSGTPIVQRWVPLARISPNLPVAVILSEDARFCRHSGVDWGELRDAIESAGDGVARGGSTISMQVVKNLFLWPSKSYLRKALEIPLAYLIELAWSKPRVLEIYLNIAEWGPGVFGAEAAARYHFRKPASLLGPREAALLAVSLPNPFERDAGRPGPGTQRLADNLLLRMRAARATAGCVRSRPASE